MLKEAKFNRNILYCKCGEKSASFISAPYLIETFCIVNVI